MPECFYDVKDVFSFGIFRCDFLVTESVLGNFAYAIVPEFSSNFFSLSSEWSREVSPGVLERFCLASCQRFKHFDKFVAALSLLISWRVRFLSLA